MSVRPRNSPNLQACEIGETNKNAVDPEVDESVKDQSHEQNKPSKLKLYGFYAIMTVLVISILALTYYLGTLTSTQQKIISSAPTSKMELKMHWKGEKDDLNKYGDNDGDACVILAQCFKTLDIKNCHENLKHYLRNYDNGFYYEGSRLIGFISSETGIEDGYGKMLIYNVCIRKEDRGKKVGQLMLPEFIKTVTGKRIQKSVSNVYVGLNVNFKSETSNSAFALYAKLGFIHWWAFCENISKFDFRVLKDQEINAQANSPKYDFPMANYILGGKAFIKNHIKRYTNFCMVMMMEKDDFWTIGKNIKEEVDKIN